MIIYVVSLQLAMWFRKNMSFKKNTTHDGLMANTIAHHEHIMLGSANNRAMALNRTPDII